MQEFLEVTLECRLGGLEPAIDAHFVGADLGKKKRAVIKTDDKDLIQSLT